MTHTDTDLQKFQRFEDEIAAGEKAVANLEGQETAALDALVKELNISNPAAIPARKKALEAELAKLERQFSDGLAALEQQFNWD